MGAGLSERGQKKMGRASFGGPLDNPSFIGYNPSRTQRGRGAVPATMLQREPLVGEKGRADGGEYTLELAPQRPTGQVGVLRERPLLRGRVLARREAVLREETANQRWYREICSPSVPDGTGAFLLRGSSRFRPERRVPLREKRKGTALVFLAAVLYSIGGICIKVIPWSGMAINGGRTAIALVVIGIYLLLARHPLRFNRWIALGALAVFGTNALYAVANKLTTAANVIVLQYTAPIFVMLFSALFLRRKPQRLDLMACAAVFGGILFFFLDSLQMGGGAGNVLALLSGVSYAGVFLLGDLPDTDPISSVFWGDLLSAVTGLPFLLRETAFTPTAITSLVILGAFQVGLAYVVLCIGLKTTPPVTASLISGIEPVLNPVLVAVFYGEAVGPFALVGAVVVISAVALYNVLKIKTSAKLQDAKTI